MPQSASRSPAKSEVSAKSPASTGILEVVRKSLESALERVPAGLGIRASVGPKQEILVEHVRPGANAAGLRSGDLIIGFNGKTINATDIVKQMNADRDGDFKLKLKRGGSVMTVEISNYRALGSLGTRSESVSVANMTLDNGIKIRAGHAPCITAVSDGGAAEKLGLRAGDLILAIKRSGEENFTVFGGKIGNEKFVEYANSLKAGQKVTIVFGRHDGHYGIKSHTSAQVLQRRSTVPLRETFSL